MTSYPSLIWLWKSSRPSGRNRRYVRYVYSRAVAVSGLVHVVSG